MTATSDTSTQTVLVTGGAGFIGCAISSGLVDRFDRVVVLDNMHPQIHASPNRPAELADNAELIVGDVTIRGDWDELLADVTPDVVIHLAAETGTGQSLEESTRHASVNVVGTSQMLDALNRHDKRPRRIVLTSSRAVYGEGAWERTATGDVIYPGQRSLEILERAEWDFPGATPTAMRAGSVFPAPVSVYGATKLAQEQLIEVWSKSYGIEAVVLRLQNVYGPGQSLINPYTGIMSLFCRLAKEGVSIPLYEDGEVRRDFVLIDDVASALIKATTAGEGLRKPVDIGAGEIQTIRTAAELIAAYYDAPAPHVTGQYRHGDVRHAWADISAAQRELDWQPAFSLAEGIQRLASWIDDQPAS